MSAGGLKARRFVGFAAIGALGFLVDAAVLKAGLGLLGPYGARLLSFLCAVTFTYALNRRFVFAADARQFGWIEGWGRFALANLAGGLVNLGVYGVLVGRAPAPLGDPVAAAGAGSLAGLAINFILTSKLVFRRR